MKKMAKTILILWWMITSCAIGLAQDQKPSKEEVLESIMDINVSEEEAIEILSKYYPELLNPVVEAKKDYERANAVDNSKTAGQYYQDLGQKSLDKKEYSQAIIYFQKAILQKKQSQQGSEKSPELSISYQGLGSAQQGQNKVEEALRSFQRGLIANASEFNDEDLLMNPKASDVISTTLAIPIFQAKGNLLLQSANDQNQLLAALIAYERAIEILDLVCKKYTSEYAQLELTEQITLLSEKAIQAALKLYQTTRNKQYKNKIFSIAEKGKAMILTSTLLASKAKTLSKVPPGFLKREQQLKTRIAQIKQSKTQQNEKQLFALTQALFFLQDSLKTYYPPYEYLKFVPPTIAMDSLQRFLAQEDAALIEYFFGAKYAFVFTLTGDDFHIERITNLEEINKSVFELRADLQSQNFKQNAEQSFRIFCKNAGSIYSYALEAALKPLDQRHQTLFIIPDGALWLLPFELLLSDQVDPNNISFSPNDLPYLLNQYSISYAHSSKLLLENHAAVSTEGTIPFAGFAPNFDGQELAARSCLSEHATLGQLGFNQSELEGIAPYFNGEVHYAEAASKSTFVKAAPQAEIIHLSTHACLNKDDPMDSRIFFSNQQYLTTEAIYQLKLQAKMAVLSACQTGLGQIYNGEGVLSLARAFAQAGCPSVTMSLWPVVDKTTAIIMINYYENLDQGMNKGRALRQAKLSFLETQSKAKQHPYYWAAFVHLGDFAPIQTATGNGMLFWVFALGGVIVLGFFLKKRR